MLGNAVLALSEPEARGINSPNLEYKTPYRESAGCGLAYFLYPKVAQLWGAPPFVEFRS